MNLSANQANQSNCNKTSMILSPYRNPPYRSPTPGDETSPQTPKRKREDALEQDGRGRPLKLETQIHSDEVGDAGANSPRTKVANRLRELDIRQTGPIPSYLNEPGEQPKRIKRRSGGYDSPLQSPSSSSDLERPEASDVMQVERAEPATAEVEETPDCRTKAQRSPQSLSPLRSPTRLIAYVEITPPKRVLDYEAPGEADAPSSSPSTGLPVSGQDSIDRSASPLPSKGDLTTDQAALTWQEHEITGHEIDPGGDDDGEGINGIGFRPTAAMAAARQQRRKQQVNEWRAREAKEARQKRFERRRIGSGDSDGRSDLRSHASSNAGDSDPTSSPSLARIVRFVGAG